jgi:sugar-specific transcriptional regulator TrmB
MKRRICDLLARAGLREEETALYLLLLKKRRASASELFAEGGLNVMTGYRTLKRLQDRGLVTAAKVNQKQSVYAPLTLQTLIEKLDREQRRMRKLQLALQGLDPLLPFLDLEAMTDDDEPVEVHEGLEAFREQYLTVPEHCEDEFLHIGSMQNYWDVAGMGDESPEELAFRAKRYAGNVFARVLNTYSPEIVEVGKRDSKELRTMRITDDLPLTKDYLAYTAKDVRHFVCDPKNPRVVIIRHPELVAIHRRQFEDLWRAGTNA